MPEETIVRFSNQGKGVYGDIRYELPLKGGGEYTLSVIMGDGRRYTANTQIPELFKWKIPDSVLMPLELKQYGSGAYSEKNKKLARFPFSVESKIGYIVVQSNSEYDSYNSDQPGAVLLFADRSNFLRAGSAYSLYDASDFPDKRTVYTGWGAASDRPLHNSEHRWMSVSQLNISMSRFYYSLFRFVGNEPDGRFYRQDAARVKARLERDTTFLFDISNIKKVGENGEVLPEAQADAIGVFGGYSAAYHTLTVIPERSWDPDTLNWGNQKN